MEWNFEDFFNDQEFEISSGTILGAFLITQNQNLPRLMVEINIDTVSPAAEVADLVLQEGDHINGFAIVPGG